MDDTGTGRLRIVHTDGRNPDFVDLCRRLDENLDEIVGGHIQRSKYDRYNRLDDIHDAVVIYFEGCPAAGGSFKRYDDETAEVKRVFVRKEYRGRGLSKVLMNELTDKARRSGYRRMILETGELLEASMGLYRRVGFEVIENYGQYKDMKESVCMGMVLPDSGNGAGMPL